MKPATVHNSDAVYNIGYAVGVMQTLEYGVYIAMNGRLFDPFNVVKNSKQNGFEKKIT